MALPTTGHVLTYAGIALKLTRVTEHSVSNVMNSDNTEVMFRRHHIVCQGIVNPATNTSSQNNAAYITEIRKVLAEPRRALTYTIAGDSLYNIPAGGDANNGPYPTDLVSVVQITGQTMLVSFGVEFFQAVCDSQQQTPDILSHRWSVTHDVNDLGLSTIIVEGSLKVKAGVNPNTYYPILGPVKSQPAGFIRSSRKQYGSDTTELNYTLTDVEQYKAPTNGIVRWEGTYTEGSDYDGQHGPLIENQFRASAIGQKEMTKGQILDWLIAVANSRLKFDGTDRLRNYHIEESLHENKVTLAVNVISNTNGAVNNAFRVHTRIGATIPVIDGGSQTPSKPFGNVVALIAPSPITTSICADKTGGVPNMSAVGAGSVSIGIGATAASNSPISTTNSGQVSQAQIDAPYLRYKLEAKIQTTQNRFRLPIAKATAFNQQDTPNVASPTTVKRVRFYCERVGAAVELPSKTIDTNHVLINQEYDIYEPEGLPDGKTVIYKAGGWYEFALKNELNESAFSLPKNPMFNPVNLSVSATANLIPPN